MKFILAAGVAVAALSAAPAYAQQAPMGYSANCQACHRPTGEGSAVAPRLAGRIETTARNPGGRKWLIASVLFGQSGKILVDGKPVSGMMPSMARLSDADIAQVLTFLTKGKAPAFTPAEVQAVRAGPKKTAAQVAQERARLAGAGIVK